MESGKTALITGVTGQVPRRATAATRLSSPRQQTPFILIQHGPGRTSLYQDPHYARDYVRGMWLILQQDCPDDYVLATGACCSVRQFVECAFAEIGIAIEWRGEGAQEKGYDAASGRSLNRR